MLMQEGVTRWLEADMKWLLSAGRRSAERYDSAQAVFVVVIFGNDNDPAQFHHLRWCKAGLVIAHKHHALARMEIDGHALRITAIPGADKKISSAVSAGAAGDEYQEAERLIAWIY